MKKILTIAILSVLTLTTHAQTLRVNMGDVTYAIPASQTGDMLYQEGTSLKIGDKVYSLSDITNITIDNRSVSDNSVVVNYSGNSAKVEISGNIAPFITAKVNGAHVCVAASDNLAQNVTYTLSGNSSNGSFYMEGSHAMQLVLSNLSLTNPDSAAINIQNGKMIGVELADGTSNSLADGLTNAADDDSDGHKAAFYIDGHSSWTGAGSLSITGNVKHAYDSDEYTLLNEGLGTITVHIEHHSCWRRHRCGDEEERQNRQWLPDYFRRHTHRDDHRQRHKGNEMRQQHDSDGWCHHRHDKWHRHLRG